MKYFFDTDIIIELLEEENKDADFKIEKIRKEIEEIKEIEKILKNPDNEFFINDLVQVELLRAVESRERFEKRKDILNIFEQLIITKEIYDDTISYSRWLISNKIKLGKNITIDIIHFITAKTYALEILSFDKHFAPLKKYYEKYEQYKKSLP